MPKEEFGDLKAADLEFPTFIRKQGGEILNRGEFSSVVPDEPQEPSPEHVKINELTTKIEERFHQIKGLMEELGHMIKDLKLTIEK